MEFKVFSFSLDLFLTIFSFSKHDSAERLGFLGAHLQELVAHVSSVGLAKDEICFVGGVSGGCSN
jgi:hypothetical protein